MSHLLALDAIACEKVLIEADGVPSTIRMLDIVLVDTSISPDQRSPVPVSLLVRARFSVGEENDTVVKIRIIRANGEETAIEEHPVKLENNGKFPEAPSDSTWHYSLASSRKILGHA